MISGYELLIKTHLFHGIGITERKIVDLLMQNEFKRIAVLVDEGVAKNSSYFPLVLDKIDKGIDKIWVEQLRGTEEPDYDYLDEVTEKFRQRRPIDAVIAIGGGSSLDMAKGVAVLMNNPGKGIEYRGFDKVLNPGIPTILIPSTAGTGSEVTNNAVFIDKREMRKFGINGRFMNATFGILDSEWTASCPTDAAVSAGMDAMVHALESFMTKKANTLTRSFSKEAFVLLLNNLPCLVEDPTNVEKRQSLLYGSWLAAVALFNSGSSVAAAMSYPLGVYYNVPHGIGGGIFITSLIEFNINHGYFDFAELTDMVHPSFDSTPEEKCWRLVNGMRSLCDKIGVPRDLSKWGIAETDVKEFSRIIIPFQEAMDQNPVPFNADTDALDLLRKHISL